MEVRVASINWAIAKVADRGMNAGPQEMQIDWANSFSLQRKLNRYQASECLRLSLSVSELLQPRVHTEFVRKIFHHDFDS